MNGAEQGSERFGFIERWLLRAELPEDDVPVKGRIARERARRLPWPFNWLNRVVILLIDWFAPAIALRKFRCAHHLSLQDFGDLLDWLQKNPVPFIRTATLLALYPVIEAMTPEPAPPTSGHPLTAAVNAPLSVDAEFDVAVIGSGAGGAPLAWQLSRDGFRVALIEKGGIVEPLTAGAAIEKYYVSQSIVGPISGHNLMVMAGSALGGTTPINAGTSLRPRPECLAEWDAALGTRFADGELDPYLDTAWALLRVTVHPEELLSASSRKIRDGLQALGRDGAVILPRSAPDCQGSGRCFFGCPKGAKYGTDLAFIPGAIEAGAALFHHTTAGSITEYADHVEIGIDGPGGQRRITAKHLVLSAGGLFTPGLIRRNRLGCSWRQAGKALKIHPAAKVIAYFPDFEHSDGGIPQGLGYRAPELPRVTFEGVHTPATATGPTLMCAGQRLPLWLAHHDHLASYGLMIRDRNSGRVFEWRGLPFLRYKLHAQDARDIAAGLKIIGEAFLAAGAKRVFLPLTWKTNEFTSMDEIRLFNPEQIKPRNSFVAGFHPQGTAGMGRVTEVDLRLKGCRRISVCDASVFPNSPGVNPQITITALALRLADRLRQELRT